MYSVDSEKLGRKLYGLIVASGMTVKEFCRIHGLNRRVISELCNGKRHNVSIQTIGDFAKAVKVPLGKIFEGTEL